MGRFIGFLYGMVAYLIGSATLAYAFGFVETLLVPKDIDSGPVGPASQAMAVDLALIALFAVQHSVMARKPFKAWWTRVVPPVLERSTYLLLTSAVLALMFWQWRPLPAAVWQVETPWLADAVLGLSCVGWLITMLSTFLINHFELFGLQQVTHNLTGRAAAAPRFHTPLFYRFVRHPLYFGLLIAFWAAPTMSQGRLLFAAANTAYILIGIVLEERDLVAVFGDEYRRYRAQVSMLLPWRRSA